MFQEEEEEDEPSASHRIASKKKNVNGFVCILRSFEVEDNNWSTARWGWDGERA